MYSFNNQSRMCMLIPNNIILGTYCLLYIFQYFIICLWMSVLNMLNLIVCDNNLFGNNILCYTFIYFLIYFSYAIHFTLFTTFILTSCFFLPFTSLGKRL